jgi:hypothetical protein
VTSEAIAAMRQCPKHALPRCSIAVRFTFNQRTETTLPVSAPAAWSQAAGFCYCFR